MPNGAFTDCLVASGIGIRWPSSPTFPGRRGNLRDMRRRPRDEGLAWIGLDVILD